MDVTPRHCIIAGTRFLSKRNRKICNAPFSHSVSNTKAMTPRSIKDIEVGVEAEHSQAYGILWGYLFCCSSSSSRRFLFILIILQQTSKFERKYPFPHTFEPNVYASAFPPPCYPYRGPNPPSLLQRMSKSWENLDDCSFLRTSLHVKGIGVSPRNIIFSISVGTMCSPTQAVK